MHGRPVIESRLLIHRQPSMTTIVHLVSRQSSGAGADRSVAVFQRRGLFIFGLHFFQRSFRRFLLGLQFPDRDLKIIRPLARGLGEGRIGEMRRIGNARLAFLQRDLMHQFLCHPLEFGHHLLQLVKLPAFFVDLKFLQANQAVTRLHTQYSMDSETRIKKALCPLIGPFNPPVQPAGLTRCAGMIPKSYPTLIKNRRR
ncbi:hypothetical protein Atu2433 [Agrobacterium fabrum str. C58]|uniref:Uncharacterized protein n=1 Tax=Agrobacterium fabrum (strain C58 / ATCC 33970) TaxID=176299 RepID=A9CHV1_AGRFC|nr:hypothetical protein Atu2433 [Agrobacterium fabrum str. C58]